MGSKGKESYREATVMFIEKLCGIHTLSCMGNQFDGSSAKAEFKCREAATSDPECIYVQGENRGKVDLALKLITKRLVGGTARVMQKNRLPLVKLTGYVLEVGIKVAVKQIKPVVQSQIKSLN